MRKLLISFCLLVLCSTPIARHVHEIWSPKAIDKLIDKTVIVEVYSENDGSLGAGVVISKEGLVLTAAHVVDASTPSIILISHHNGNFYTADLLNINIKNDLALLQLKHSAQEFNYAKIQQSTKLNLGQPILVIGHPMGDFWTVTIGHITRLVWSFYYYCKVIELDAVINPGNSGGPVFNEKGELIGIISAIQIRFFVIPTGIGYAIHVDTIHKFLRDSKAAIEEYELAPPRYRIGDLK